MGHDLHPKSPRFQVLTPDEEEDNGFEGGVLSSPGNPGEAAKPQHGDQSGVHPSAKRAKNGELSNANGDWTRKNMEKWWF